MFRTVFILLTVSAILICPFMCLGEGDCLCAHVTQYGDCHDCQHECVTAKATVKAGQKTPREIIRSITEAGACDLVLPAQPSTSIAVATALRGSILAYQPHSGWRLHVTLASFLL